MPNTGLFYLFEVACDPGQTAATSCGTIGEVQAQCLSCRHVFKASAPPALLNIYGGGAVLRCPRCAIHQAISGARFNDFANRFPAGNAAGSSGLDKLAAPPSPSSTIAS